MPTHPITLQPNRKNFAIERRGCQLNLAENLCISWSRWKTVAVHAMRCTQPAARLLSDGCVPPIRTLSTHIPHFGARFELSLSLLQQNSSAMEKTCGHRDKHRIARRPETETATCRQNLHPRRQCGPLRRLCRSVVFRRFGLASGFEVPPNAAPGYSLPGDRWLTLLELRYILISSRVADPRSLRAFGPVRKSGVIFYSFRFLVTG
jgi:hypothetical protein